MNKLTGPGSEVASTSGQLIRSGYQATHTLYYERYGNPQGEPLALLHAGPALPFTRSQLGFVDQQKFDVIYMHQRGVARSQPSRQPGGRRMKVDCA